MIDKFNEREIIRRYISDNDIDMKTVVVHDGYTCIYNNSDEEDPSLWDFDLDWEGYGYNYNCKYCMPGVYTYGRDR